jgi:hypothetical protein
MFAEIMEGIRVECKDLDGKKMCKPIKVGDPVDEGFKLMKDIRVDKTMVDGKANFKAININKSASQDDTPLVPGGKLLDLRPVLCLIVFSFFNLLLFHVVKHILTA